MYLTVSSVPSNFIHIYVLLTKVKDKSGKKNDVKLLSTRMKRSLPCATPTPSTSHREFFQQKHIITEPLATIGSHFTAKTYPLLRTARTVRGGEERPKNHKINHTRQSPAKV